MTIFVKDKKFYKTLVALALPIALQSLITVGVNMADNLMLGQLGESGMSAATLANNFISVYQIMCMGLGMGASVLVSRFFGMGDQLNMKRTVNIMFRLEFAFAALFSVVTALFPSQIMHIFSKDEGVVAAGVGYLLISIPCYFLNGYAVTTSLMLRSVDRANVPLIASIFALFVNIFFNWMFIFGNLGAPEMGVNGAALGTLLARIVEFSITMGFLFWKEKNIGFRFKDLFMPVGELLPDYIRICIPVMVSDGLLGFGNSATAAIMGNIGATFVAANAITTVTLQLATVVISGISQASCAMTGITLGKGETAKAKQQAVTFAALGFLIGGVGCGIILLLKGTIIDFYKVLPETKALAGQLMDAVAIVIWFQAANSILTKGTLRGGGDTRFLMFFDISFLWLVSIPFGALAGLVWKWEGFYVYLMLRSDHFLKCIFCLLRLKSGRWIKQIKKA